MECEVMSKTYEQIKVIPAAARVIGEMELHGNTYGFYLTATLVDQDLVFIPDQKATLITEAESVLVTKAAGSEWVAGEPIFWLEATSNFTNVNDGSGILVGKAAEGAATGALVGYMVMHDYYPVQRGMQLGTALVPYKIDGEDPLLALYTTSDALAAAGNVEPVIVNTVLTGIGATGGRARFQLNTEAALGGWANALKAVFDFGVNGSVGGLGSAFCAEISTPSGGMSRGTYTALELEFGAEGSGIPSNKHSLIYANIFGAAKTEFDTHGFLLDLNCEAEGSGTLVNGDITTVAGGIRMLVNGVIKWLCYSD